MAPTRFLPGTSYEAVTATVAVGAHVTSEIDLGDLRLMGIITDANLTATALTFQAGAATGAEANLYDTTGAEVNLTVSTSKAIPVDYTLFYPFRFLIVRTGTSGSPTNQSGTTTTITLVCVR